MRRILLSLPFLLALGCGRTELFDRAYLDTAGGPDGGPQLDVGADADAGLDLGVDTGLDSGDDVGDAGPGDGKLGDPCTSNAACESGICAVFGDEQICTVPCTDTCPAPGFVCFEGTCTPEDFCSAAGTGPGCVVSCEQCDENASCVEREDGSLSCICNEGYAGSGVTCDINECLSMPCAEEAICTDLQPGYACACAPGWRGDGEVCEDVDECGEFSDNCSINATCINIPGSFVCDCLPGFEGNGVACSDINECLAGDLCGVGTCQNLTGGYSCVCPDGFEFDGSTCVGGVDECAEGTDNCDVNALCTNTSTGFLCSCNAGYSGDGTQCSDVDECLDPSVCGPLQTCTNTAGSYSCACAPGTISVGNTCVLQGDVCAAPFTVTGVPFTGANNTTGFNHDYRFQGGQCPGVNGGRGNNTADQVWAFTPTTSGNYRVTVDAQNWLGVAYVVTDCGQIGTTCLGADDGDPNLSVAMTAGTTYYVVIDGAFGQTGAYTLDVSLDECASGTDNCAAEATCTDTRSGFECVCPEGFSGDGLTCSDIDECTNGSAGCDVNATCTNTVGGFECTCNAGYTGDGLTCSDLNAPGETCASPFVIGALPYSFSGSTADANNDYSAPFGSCPGLIGGGDASNDEVFSFTPSANGTYRLSVTADFAAILYVRTACTENATCLAGDQPDFNGSGPTVDVTLLANVTYFVVVDGIGRFQNISGNYTLNVSQL